MIDIGRVRRLLDRLRLETDRLRRLADRPAKELLSDEVALGAAQFRFLLAIEVCVDIGRHIIASASIHRRMSGVDRVATGQMPPDLG